MNLVHTFHNFKQYHQEAEAKYKDLLHGTQMQTVSTLFLLISCNWYLE